MQDKPTETRAQQVQRMYCRLALYVLGRGKVPYADLRIPTRYFASVIQEVKDTYPDILTYVVEWYGGHSRVVLWHPTAKPVVQGADTELEPA